MTEEKNLIEQLLTALLNWLEATTEAAQTEKKWTEDLMGTTEIPVELSEVDDWSDEFQEAWE
jgi:hypothetical protein